MPLVKNTGSVLGHNLATTIGIIIFFLKTFFFIFVFIWIRWTLPRFKYDQLMNLAWKWMLPLSVANLIIEAAAELTPMPFLASWVGLVILALGYVIFRPLFFKKNLKQNLQ